MHRLIAGAVLAMCLAGCARSVEAVRDPLVVEQHRSRISKVRHAIDETRGVIAASRGAPYLPELYMRLAELTSEEARYHYMVAAEREKGAESALHVPQVRALKEQAIGTYTQILTRFPDSHLLDRVLFNISQEHRELGNFDDMRSALERLVREHPGSRYHSEALLVLGNYHFDKSELQRAKGYFEEIIGAHSGPLLGLAHYRLGWVYVNLADCERALTHFEKAIDAAAAAKAAAAAPLGETPNWLASIESLAEGGGPPEPEAGEVRGEFEIPRSASDAGFAGHRTVDVQREALVDLAYCYAQVRPPEHAATYLRQRAVTRQAYVAALAKMANRFALIEQPRGAAEVTRELLRLAPDDPDRLDDARMLHNVVTRMQDYSSVGEDVSLILDAMQRRTLRPDHDVAAGQRAAQEFDSLARDLATRSQAVLRGEATGGTEWTETPATPGQTAHAYLTWIATFPASPYRLEMVQNLADVLLEAGRFLDAGKWYREAADMLRADAPARGTSLAALSSPPAAAAGEEKADGPRQLTAQERVQQRLDALFNASVAYQRALEDAKDNTHVELSVARAGLRHAGSAYLTEGQPPPDKALRIKFAMGRSFYDEADYLRAIDLLTAVAYEYPGTEQGDAAAHLVLDSFNTTNDISGLYAVGQRFMAPDSPVSAQVKAEIRPIVDAAEQRRLDELSLAASGDSAGGMEVLLAFADRYRDSDLGERALLGTFVAARAAGDTEQLFSVGSELLQRSQGSDQAAGVANTLGQTAAAQFEFDKAVEFLEQAAKLSGDPVQSSSYLLAAGKLREQLADPQGAEKAYRGALGLAGMGENRSRAIASLADLTEDYGTPQDLVRLLAPLAGTQDPEVLSRLGLALVRSGRVDEGEMYLQQVVSGAAAASPGAQARAYYGVAEASLNMLKSYRPPSELEAIEEAIGMVEVTIQSFLAAARQPDLAYSQAALARLATAADTGAALIRGIQLPTTLTQEESTMLRQALQTRSEQLLSGRDEAIGECAQRALSTHQIDATGRACLLGQPPPAIPIQPNPLKPRRAATSLPNLAQAKERLARNPSDVDALRAVGVAYLDAGDPHAARLVLGRAVDAGGGAEDINLLGVAAFQAGDQLGAQDAFGRAGAAGSGAAMRNLAHLYRGLDLIQLADETLLEAPPGAGRLIVGAR